MFDWYETHFEEAIEDRPITEEGAGQR